MRKRKPVDPPEVIAARAELDRQISEQAEREARAIRDLPRPKGHRREVVKAREKK